MDSKIILTGSLYRTNGTLTGTFRVYDNGSGTLNIQLESPYAGAGLIDEVTNLQPELVFGWLDDCGDW